LHLPLRVRGHFIGGAVVRWIDHGQRQVACAVEIRRDDSQLSGHVRRHRRQDVAWHSRKGSGRHARDAQVLLERRDKVLLV